MPLAPDDHVVELALVNVPDADTFVSQSFVQSVPDILVAKHVTLLNDVQPLNIEA